jgi:hypothetical protein
MPVYACMLRLVDLACRRLHDSHAICIGCAHLHASLRYSSDERFQVHARQNKPLLHGYM